MAPSGCAPSRADDSNGTSRPAGSIMTLGATMSSADPIANDSIAVNTATTRTA
ncbi:hypothetical protein ACIBHX_47840 [Nonomuraea sp. NPDC050536]|uniref:hypothetical protein n=1 Tax=Nonomuraea sp. NPDC050536 TaxID=3364366 RepID=UPI0037C70029